MSLALYRRYRPGTFAEVIGQDHVTQPLTQAIRSGKVHHAYLFSGPRGCGKTSSARILARSLNCAQGPTPEPCGVCESCVALAPNGPGSLDVMEIDAASHGGVDDARDLRERAFYAPVSSRYKVYIVDEAHMVSREGFNALLKLVEEPPPHLKFVFATTEPEKVIGTIRSRTHHYPFRLIPPRELLTHLTDICAREGVDVDPLVLPLVVRAGAGSARDALSVLDQLLAGAGPEGLTYARAVALLGYTDAELLDEVVDAFAAADAAAVLQAVDRVVESGHDPRRFAADLLERVRDLIVVDAVPGAAEKGLIDAPADQLDRMRAQAARFGQGELSRAGDILAAGLTEMRGATAPRLLLELLCARLLLPAAATDAGSVLARLDRIERRLDIVGPGGGQPSEPRPAPAARRLPGEPVGEPAPPRVAPASNERSGSTPWPEPARPKEPAPESAATGPQESAPTPPPSVGVSAPLVPPSSPLAPDAEGGLDAAAVRRVWPQVLDAVKARRKMTTWALLSQYAQVVGVRGRSLLLAFATEPIRRQWESGVNEQTLVDVLHEILGVDWRIEAMTAAEPTQPAGAAASDFGPGDDPRDDTADDAADDAAEPALPPEEQAVALLQNELGAKVIGEIDAG